MNTNKLLPFSILALALCILFGSFFIGKSIENAAVAQVPVPVQVERALLTQQECAEYLNITEDELKGLIAQQLYQKSQMSSYNPYQYLSFLEVDGKKMFSKNTLDMWINFSIYGVE